MKVDRWRSLTTMGKIWGCNSPTQTHAEEMPESRCVVGFVLLCNGAGAAIYVFLLYDSHIEDVNGPFDVLTVTLTPP